MNSKIITKDRKNVPLTWEQVKALLNESRDNPEVIQEQIKIGLVLMVIYGLRASELLSLSVDNISLENETLILTKSKQQPITIPLVSDTIVLFNRLIKLAGKSEYLFPELKGKGTSLSSHKFVHATRKLLPPFNLSGLRLFFAHFLFERDISLEIASTLLNKKYPYYRQFNFDYLKERHEIYCTLSSLVLPEAFSNEQLTKMGAA
jgi:integrase